VPVSVDIALWVLQIQMDYHTVATAVQVYSSTCGERVPFPVLVVVAVVVVDYVVVVLNCCFAAVVVCSFLKQKQQQFSMTKMKMKMKNFVAAANFVAVLEQVLLLIVMP